jgi:hypothetical protein
MPQRLTSSTHRSQGGKEGDEGAGRGSDGIGGGVRRQRGDRSCKTKVAHFDQAVGVEEHVRGLHVTMQHPRRVHVLERLEQLVHDILLVHLPTQSCNVSLACQSEAISSSGILVSASPLLVTRRQPSSHTHTARTLDANEVAGATTFASSSRAPSFAQPQLRLLSCRRLPQMAHMRSKCANSLATMPNTKMPHTQGRPPQEYWLG